MNVQQLPVDRQSAEALAAEGLRLALVDCSDRDAFAAWTEANARGFHEASPEPQRIDEHLEHAPNRRTSGVFDDSIPDGHVPVATSCSWVAALTVPGEKTLDSWAISSVTVAPTHRRRGVARAMLEAELRTAAAAGVPMASLTVSEATIYGRFGFGRATRVGHLEIDTKRAGWVGPSAAPGRLVFVSPRVIADTGRDVFDRARLATPGELDADPFLWGRMVGALGGDAKIAGSLRVVRYEDADGVPQGFAVYRLVEDEHDFTKHTVDLRRVVAATDEANAAIWRYLLELDLVAKLTYYTASPDEPVLWMIRDARAASLSLRDHHWLRILDLKAALETRTYGAPASLVLRVTDGLGFCNGTIRLDVAADGTARVTPTDAAPDLDLDIAALSALYLGDVKASTLVSAGLVHAPQDAAIRSFDAAFRSEATPWLSYWY